MITLSTQLSYAKVKRNNLTKHDYICKKITDFYHFVLTKHKK